MKGGGLVDNAIVLRLFSKQITDTSFISSGWLLDGYPRNVQQAVQVEEVLERERQPLDAVISLKVPFKVIEERISGRWIHEKSGRTYNVHFNPPKVVGIDDQTGEALIQREDDVPHVVKKRFETFLEKTQPLFDFYRKRKIFFEVDAPSSPEGYKHIKPLLQSLQQSKLSKL